MVVTPYLSKLKEGYFVTFQSTDEDLTFTTDVSNNRIRFSKYALLDIPEIRTSVNGKNSIQFQNIEGAFVNGLSTSSPPPSGDRIDLSESLQNYLMNMEALILNSKDYNPNTKKTVAERCFFKWLKEIGAIRFNVADNLISNIQDRFTEESENTDIQTKDFYSRVVKVIGDIDMVGSHRSQANTFKEIYIYIPTESGHTPTVLFESLEDNNYKPSMAIKKSGVENIEFIEGSDSNDDPTIAGLSVKAIYDSDVPYGSLSYLINNDINQEIWFAPLTGFGTDCYFTDVAFKDASNDIIKRLSQSSSQNVQYKRSRLDGISIDFNIDNYTEIKNNDTIKSLADFNNSGSSDSYKFNTVLLYYDVFDANNPSDITTNLYGVYFLKDVVPVSGGGAKIDSYLKIKPNNVLSRQGNGFGFKINLKTGGQAYNSLPEVEISVNEYNTFSMQLFAEAMARMGSLSIKYESALLDIVYMKQKISDLEQIIINGSNKQMILKKLSDIDRLLSEKIPNDDLRNMYTGLNNIVSDILKGKTSVDLNLVLDIIPSDGLDAKISNNKLLLKNSRQAYSSINEFNMDMTPYSLGYLRNVLPLKEFSSILYHKNGGERKIATGNIGIYIDDSLIPWKTNQSLKIVIADHIDFLQYGILIFTDANNKSGLSSPYSALVDAVSTDRIGSKSTFEIEIICIDSQSYKFISVIR